MTTPATTKKTKAAPVPPALLAEIPPVATAPAETVAAAPVETEPKPASKPKKEGQKPKSGKAKPGKVIRDSFTMSQDDYALIADLKEHCLQLGIPVKKSELLRAGLHALSALGEDKLKKAIMLVETIKTGRPAKGK